MGAVNRDLEERTSNKADEIAEQRYGREFNALPQTLQSQVWQEVAEKVHSHPWDGQRITHWDELELLRRMGK